MRGFRSTWWKESLRKLDLTGTDVKGKSRRMEEGEDRPRVSGLIRRPAHPDEEVSYAPGIDRRRQRGFPQCSGVVTRLRPRLSAGERGRKPSERNWA